MNVLKNLKKAGIVVALTAAMTLVAPMASPACANVTTVSAATVKLSKSKLTLVVGKTSTLKVSGTKGKVTWSSSDKKIATVSSNGKVKAVSMGTAKITAKVGSKKLTCTVNVTPFAGKKTAFESGNSVIVPKGWLLQVGNNSGIEYVAVKPDENTNSNILLYKITPSDSKQLEKLMDDTRKSYTKEGMESILEKQLGIDLKTEVFDSDDSTKEDIESIYCGGTYSSDGIQVLSMYNYVICDGTYIYQISSVDFGEVDINWDDYTKYIANSLKIK